MGIFEQRPGAHFRGGRAYYSPLADEVERIIKDLRREMWRFVNRKDIRRYGERTVRKAMREGISPFDAYYG